MEVKLEKRVFCDRLSVYTAKLNHLWKRQLVSNMKSVFSGSHAHLNEEETEEEELEEEAV